MALLIWLWTDFVNCHAFISALHRTKDELASQTAKKKRDITKWKRKSANKSNRPEFCYTRKWEHWFHIRFQLDTVVIKVINTLFLSCFSRLVQTNSGFAFGIVLYANVRSNCFTRETKRLKTFLFFGQSAANFMAYAKSHKLIAVPFFIGTFCVPIEDSRIKIKEHKHISSVISNKQKRAAH